MTIWFIHRRDDGTIASAHEGNIVDGQAVSPMPDYCSEALDDATDAEIQAFFAAADAAPRIITPREFRLRFTDAEQDAIDAAAMTDKDVFKWRMRAAEAQQINLDLDETKLGLQFLVSKQLVASSRVDELLA